MADDNLTYSDVHLILAMTDTWPKGSIRFRHDALDVRIAMAFDSVARSELPTAPLIEVTATAVGLFMQPSAIEPGAPVVPGTGLGNIAAPGRDTSVQCEVHGRMVRYQVPDRSFVEYGQVLALVEREAAR